MEKEVSDTEKRLLVKKKYLDRLNYDISRGLIDHAELYAMVKGFFTEFLGLDYEFTYEELSKELNKLFIKPTLKKTIDQFLFELTESEYLEGNDMGQKEAHAFMMRLKTIIENIIADAITDGKKASFFQKLFASQPKNEGEIDAVLGAQVDVLKKPDDANPVSINAFSSPVQSSSNIANATGSKTNDDAVLSRPMDMSDLISKKVDALSSMPVEATMPNQPIKFKPAFESDAQDKTQSKSLESRGSARFIPKIFSREINKEISTDNKKEIKKELTQETNKPVQPVSNIYDDPDTSDLNSLTKRLNADLEKSKSVVDETFSNANNSDYLSNDIDYSSNEPYSSGKRKYIGPYNKVDYSEDPDNRQAKDAKSNIASLQPPKSKPEPLENPKIIFQPSGLPSLPSELGQYQEIGSSSSIDLAVVKKQNEEAQMQKSGKQSKLAKKSDTKKQAETKKQPGPNMKQTAKKDDADNLLMIAEAKPELPPVNYYMKTEDNKPSLVQIRELMEESYFSIGYKNTEVAKLKYLKALDQYHTLSLDEKKQIYLELYDLFISLSKL